LGRNENAIATNWRPTAVKHRCGAAENSKAGVKNAGMTTQHRESMESYIIS
jgi:hypothetical protein